MWKCVGKFRSWPQSNVSIICKLNAVILYHYINLKKGGIEYHAIVTNNETTALAVVAFPEDDDSEKKEIFLLTTSSAGRGRGATLVKKILEGAPTQTFSIQANNWYVKLYYKYGLTKTLGDDLAKNLEVDEETHNTGIKNKNLFEYIATECPQWSAWLSSNEGTKARKLLLRVGEVAVVEKASLKQADKNILKQFKKPKSGNKNTLPRRMENFQIQQQAREGFNKLLEDLQLDQLEPGKPLGITKVKDQTLLDKVYKKAKARYVKEHSA